MRRAPLLFTGTLIAMCTSLIAIGDVSSAAAWTSQDASDAPAQSASGDWLADAELDPAAAEYVALGDSYSSGEGVPPFLASTDTQDNRCHRSNGAYAALIRDQPRVPPRFEFWACSGAKIRDFYNPQNPLERPQLDYLNGSSVVLITVGIGGNDIGFATIGAACTSVWVPFLGQKNKHYKANCGAYLSQPDQLRPDGLIEGLTFGNVDETDGISYSLRSLYRDMRAKAPNASVYVVGYPNPLPLPTAVSGACEADVVDENEHRVGASVRGVGYHVQFKIQQADVDWMEKIVQRLNSTIQLNAFESGFYFVDNSQALRGHDVCGNNIEHWVHGVVVAKGRAEPSSFSFHPSAKGQRAMAGILRRFLARPPGGFIATVLPQKTVEESVSVSPDVYQLVVQSAWPGSDVQLSLVSPSGIVYDRSTQASGVMHHLQSTRESLAVRNPQAGRWIIRLYGASVPPSGDPVRVDTTQIEQSAFAPVAKITAAFDHSTVPVSVQLKATGSAAFNGASISSYSWSFDDGTSAMGPSQTHVFSSSGRHAVTLTVTDNNGQVDSATLAVP